MTGTVAIRTATIGNAEALHRAMLAIAETMGETHRVVSTIDDIRRYGFGDAPCFEALVAEVDGAVAGACVFFASFSTYRGRPGVYVQDLHVEPRYRRLGVGAKLLQRLAALTRFRGGVYIRLSVDARNTAAQSFYDRIGIVHSAGELIHAAYDEAFDALADAGNEPTVTA